MLHKHHITPRHAGGTDDSSNIEMVTVEQHAERHRILFEVHGRWQDELAWKGLSGIIGREEIVRFRAGAANRGKKHTEEWKQRNSELHRGRKRPPRSEEWKIKQAEVQRGLKRSEEHNRQKSAGQFGKTLPKHTLEQSIAQSVRQLGSKRGPYKHRTSKA